MKATGIVRKIDELGRIVLPKEIRDSQEWKKGQPMEMFMVEEGMVIRPYKTDIDLTEVLYTIANKLTSRPTLNNSELEAFSQIVDILEQKNKSVAPTTRL